MIEGLGKGWSERGIPRAPSTPGWLVTLRVGLGSTLVEGWSSRARYIAAAVGVGGRRESPLDHPASTSIDTERGYRSLRFGL